MASKGRKRTSAEVLAEIFADDNSSVSPDSELDESEFELDSLHSDYKANSSSESRVTDSENEAETTNGAPSADLSVRNQIIAENLSISPAVQV